MSAPFVLLSVAAVGSVAFLASAVLGALGLATRSLRARLSARARARLAFAAAVLPALVGAVVAAVLLGPSTGLLADHCLAADRHHAHAHLCSSHPMAALPSMPLLVVGAVLSARIVVAMLALARDLVRGVRVRRAMDLEARDLLSHGVRVLPWDAPNAFVLGVFSPTTYVTRGLVAGSGEHLESVLAHERAHVRRRDALRRALARLAAAFHLPGVASALGRALARAQEMAADEEAAIEVGSREKVARALVHVARATRSRPPLALAFGPTDLEARVEVLLDERERLEWPGPVVLASGVAVGLALALAGAERVHHGVEHLLALGGA